MSETNISLRDEQKSWGKPTEDLHRFKLKTYYCYVLEVRDVHFNHNSAVFLPDRAAKAGGAGPDPVGIAGLAVLRAAYKQVEENPSQKVLISGHTDRSGGDQYNLLLSQQRADNVTAALRGEKNDWVLIVEQKHKVEDIQLILKWANEAEGYGCDPGKIDNKNGPQTKAAVKSFQIGYNEDFKKSIKEDGVVGKETWEAFFDVYMDILKEFMETDAAGLKAAQDSFSQKFIDSGKKAVGCGENFPIEQPRRDNFKSVKNRRVEILFFDLGEEPQLNCHPSPNQCQPQKCEIHNQVLYCFRRIDPKPISFPLHRLTLTLGDIDKLFPVIVNKTPTDSGVRARLQAVGFLYEPLTGTSITQRANDAWNHFKTVTGKAANGDAVGELQRMVKEVIVDKGKLPEPGKFSMIRFPGTYCVRTGPGNHFADETAVWNANNSLGLVPILATVEIFRRGTWRTTGEGTPVHFQLIKPDDLPAGSPIIPPALRNAPVVGSFNMTGSPNKYVTDEKNRHPAVADDPQVDNIHRDIGGKRGHPVVGTNRLQNIFERTTTRTGFNDTLNLAAGEASTHANTVSVKTNNVGQACAIMIPAWTGGDRYKIKAFLDPVQGQPSDGTEEFAVTKETGTFVVFRILRISKYIRWDYPTTTTAAQRTNCGGNLDAIDIAGALVSEYKKFWFDVVVEPNAGRPKTLTQNEWRAAIQFARSNATVGGASQAYNVNVLIPDTDPGGNPGIHNPSPGIINFLTDTQYNTARGPGFNAAPSPTGGSAATYRNDMARVRFAIQGELIKFFSRNAISGMTIIQAPAMSNFEADRAFPTGTPNHGNSGWGGGADRGCYVVFGTTVYSNPNFPYPVTSNTIHETGHVMYRPHQYIAASEVNVSTGTNFDQHDYHDLCIMGYMKCQSDFCGRCAFHFSGVNTSAIPANNPGP